MVEVQRRVLSPVTGGKAAGHQIGVVYAEFQQRVGAHGLGGVFLAVVELATDGRDFVDVVVGAGEDDGAARFAEGIGEQLLKRMPS